jgi:hypothetical protein
MCGLKTKRHLYGARGGQIWHIRRDEESTLSKEANIHRSENGITAAPDDILINNNSDIEALHEHLDKLLTNED